MKLEMFAVHDAAVGAFNRPLFFRSRGEAVRSFTDAVADEGNGFKAHAEHYSFWYLGSFDDADGSFVSASQPERVIGAVDVALPDSKPKPARAVM